MMIDPDAYPEQILAAARDRIRALERRRARRDARRAGVTRPRAWIRGLRGKGAPEDG
ncbi:hypothetical protein CLV56_1947 [Mumia flava]|uniref:Uncharacterized protein n=1 Tax=Mumia flava TaxID=1348852 RepID=A0A2M9BIE0_9ACTN|nr:hypothetical protein CLV56_1947 [Mumia flava]